MILKNNESAFLSIGSNLGARRENLRKALSLLSGTKVAIKQSSSLYETEPIGIQQQREFINLACELTCHLEPEELLEHCLTVERQMGRCRARRNGPRIIDIDIIFFGREVIDLDHLKVPHPRRMERRFVLVPMNEIAPLLVDPVSQSTVSSMLEHCPDLSWVRKIEETSSWSASPENESDPTFR